MKSKRNKFIFEQNAGIFPSSIFVTYNYSDKEILSYVRRNYPEDKSFLKNIEIALSSNIGDDYKARLYMYQEEGKNRHPVVLRFNRRPDDSTAFYATVIHESTHILDLLSEHYGIEKEIESRAYLMEYLVHNIHKKCMK